MSEKFNVGDINSAKAGSGARANAGKDRLDYIPIRFWCSLWEPDLIKSDLVNLSKLLTGLVAWQEGELEVSLTEHMEAQCFLQQLDYEEACKVFDFGAEKYAAWNWAKGMAWSVPTGCILRHARSIIAGEYQDPESGYSHWGHIICNLIMLMWYEEAYPEGDDRPPNNDPLSETEEYPGSETWFHDDTY